MIRDDVETYSGPYGTFPKVRGVPVPPEPDGPFPWRPVLLVALAEAVLLGAFWWYSA